MFAYDWTVLCELYYYTVMFTQSIYYCIDRISLSNLTYINEGQVSKIDKNAILFLTMRENRRFIPHRFSFAGYLRDISVFRR